MSAFGTVSAPGRTTINPLREGLRLEQTPPPCTMVIFGVTGDLTHRKLMPQLYELTVDTPLPPGFSIVGYARRDWDDERFRAEMQAAVQHALPAGVDEAGWQSFAQRLCYVSANFDDLAGYLKLKETLDRIDQERGAGGNRIFYLATPPSYYPVIINNLKAAGLAQRQYLGDTAHGGWTRLVIEKPFGHDLASAQALNNEIAGTFAESQVYRIDHYLGKETVQNLLVFRFGNGIFEPIWNRQYIDNVQITVAESIGIEGRGEFYEEAGALRDIVQNHMFQVLSLIAMEPPSTINEKTVRDEKVQVLQAITPLRGAAIASDVVRGQYGPGWVGGKVAPGYRSEKGVDPDSTVETYVAMKLRIDNWRWAGVPFYLRTGKRLPERVSEIVIAFKQIPHSIFEHSAGPVMGNKLVLRLQPDEGVKLWLMIKDPGPGGLRLQHVPLDMSFAEAFGVHQPEAYERLLMDVVRGNQTLFMRRDEVEAAWAWIDPILDAWATGRDTPKAYTAGSWGPSAAVALIERDGRTWHEDAT